jgi:hypothetical protein
MDMLLEVFNDSEVLIEGNERIDEWEPRVCITMDVMKAIRIRKMRDMCNREDYAEITDWCHYPKWDELSWDGGAVRADVAQLHVTKNEFWFDCYIKHSTIKLSTEHTSVATLKAMGL